MNLSKLSLVIVSLIAFTSCTKPKEENRKNGEPEKVYKNDDRKSTKLSRSSNKASYNSSKGVFNAKSFSQKVEFIDVMVKEMKEDLNLTIVTDEGELTTVSSQSSVLVSSRKNIESSLKKSEEVLSIFLKEYRPYDDCLEDCRDLNEDIYRETRLKYSAFLAGVSEEIKSIETYKRGLLPLKGVVSIDVIQQTVQRVESLEQKLIDEEILNNSEILYTKLSEIKRNSSISQRDLDLYITSLDDLVIGLKQVLRLSTDKSLELDDTTYKLEQNGIDRVEANIKELELLLKSYRERYIKYLRGEKE